MQYDGVLAGLRDAIGVAVWPDDDRSGGECLSDSRKQQGAEVGELGSATNKDNLCENTTCDAYKGRDHGDKSYVQVDESGQCDASVQADVCRKEQVGSSGGGEEQPDVTFAALHRLVAHMEARPADLHVFGMGR